MNAFSELLPPADRLQLARLGGDALARRVEPAAQLVETQLRLDEGVFHARRDQPPLFRSGGAAQQLIERPSKPVEHHASSWLGVRLGCTIQVVSGATQPRAKGQRTA